jgi:hypothetical protein
VAVQFLAEAPHRNPAASDGRVHHLHQIAHTPPDHYEMSGSIGSRTTTSAGSISAFGQQQMIGGSHDLPGVESQRDGGFFECIDRGSVDVGWQASRNRP